MTERLMISGNTTYVPVNVEGSSGIKSCKFWTPMKSGVCILMFACVLLVPMMIADFPFRAKIFIFAIQFIIYILVTRFVLFEEIYYKNALLRRRRYNKSTSAMNWGIMYTDDKNGAIVGFMSHAYIGCFIRLERGSIVGQPPNYDEQCKDTYSEFLNMCHSRGYNVKISSCMELASKDKRLTDLADSIKDVQNRGLKDLLELNFGHIRDLSENIYYENDIILIYTNDQMKFNSILSDAIDVTAPLLQGAYLSRTIMTEADIIDLHTEINFVDYFDIVSAKTEMWEADSRTKRDFKIQSIKLKNGNEYFLTNEQQVKLGQIYNKYIHDKGAPIDILGELTSASKIAQRMQQQAKARPQTQQAQPTQPMQPVQSQAQPEVQPVSSPQRANVKPEADEGGINLEEGFDL